MNGSDAGNNSKEDNETSTVQSKKIVINKDVNKKKRKIEVISGASKSNVGSSQ